ncbi:MAG: PilZ domain-containing protein [Planctomycetes bacterium]|nr:PilZ domain-containing protein [Planctomycetota bacterium]
MPDHKRRYPRKIAAWTAWVRFHRSAKFVKGRTRNVSRRGMYVVVPLNDSPDYGDQVEYILGVPTGEGDHLAIQAINGEAQVVRVERGDDGGLALEFADEEDIG